MQLPGIEKAIRALFNHTVLNLGGAGGKSACLFRGKYANRQPVCSGVPRQVSLRDLLFSQKSLDLAFGNRFSFDIVSGALPETAAMP